MWKYSILDWRKWQNLNIAPTTKPTVIYNGTSYSGADIKLVVHIYDKGTSKKRRAAEEKADRKATEEAIKSLE
jgi:hypothetical protein